jgi:hypothetical protein
MGGTRKRPRAGLRYEHATQSMVADDPIESIGQPALHVRSPVVEQLGAQFGWAFASGGRELKPRELEVARPIFGLSIDFRPVRVVKALFLNAPTTLGNYVRIENEKKFHDAVLVHELMHVWQYQTQGTRYISNSLCAQASAIWRTGDRNAAYEVFPNQLRDVRSIHDLSAERQARVVEFYFISTLMRSPDAEQRQRLRRPSFSHLASQFTPTNNGSEQFQQECADLDRLVAQIRMARPKGFVASYTEALSPPLGTGGIYDGQPDRIDTHIMPIFRIDF